MHSKLKVAILGTGNIGTDLLIKIMRSELLQCTAFVGRNLLSKGMSKAINLGVKVSDQSIDFLKNNPELYDLVFDATTAQQHVIHAEIFKVLGKIAIDLTPAKVGILCVPSVNLSEALRVGNINTITCGGQASIPLAYILGQIHPNIEYIEVVSAISSKSAGPGTRANLDEYVETTEAGIKYFSKCQKSKVMLILNPAIPCIDMQTTIQAIIKNPDMDRINLEINKMVGNIQKYVPGYRLLVPPTYEGGRLIMTVKIKGVGDYLPSYAGNLDIINCAAIAIAEEFSRKK
ncbi:MAG TPA: acetaldehyde dehydrogenase (acetylating) [Paludibacter sp.]